MSDYASMKCIKRCVIILTLFSALECNRNKRLPTADVLEDLIPIRPRMDESAFLERVKTEKWECFKQPATELDGHLLDDLYYTCRISVDIGNGKFTTLQLVTRAKDGGGRWVMPILNYVSLEGQSAEECEAILVRSANLLQKNWSTQIKRDSEFAAAIGIKENDTSLEQMSIGCGNGRSGINWMYLEKRKPVKINGPY